MLDRRTFLVKERVAVLRLSDTYDILDPASGATIGVAEERISGALKALRLLINKRHLPTTVVIAESDGGAPILTLKRGLGFLHSTVQVLDARDRELGTLKSKLISIGGAFRVMNPDGAEVASVSGDWISWNFTFTSTDGRVLGTVTRKWAGVGRELFTTADNYMIALAPAETSPTITALLLAAGIAIDTLFKEK